MSKKTIIFQNPSKGAVPPTASERKGGRARTEASVDRWVHRPGDIVEPVVAAPITAEEPEMAPAFFTISISAEPDPFEVFKIWFLLPYLTFSFWTLATARRNLASLLGGSDGGKSFFDRK